MRDFPRFLFNKFKKSVSCLRQGGGLRPRLLPWQATLLLLTLLLLAGCVHRGKPQMEQVYSTPQMREYTTAARAQTQWGFQGRVAFKHAGEGGSGRMDWQQHGETLNLDLSAPMTRQRLRIHAIQGQSLCVDGLEPGRLCDEDAHLLLMDMFGEPLPLHLLPEWLRGLAATDTPGIMRHAPSGLPESLLQSGWTIHYQTWHPPTTTRPPLPRRLELSKDHTRLRLVIDAWSWGHTP